MNKLTLWAISLFTALSLHATDSNAEPLNNRLTVTEHSVIIAGPGPGYYRRPYARSYHRRNYYRRHYARPRYYNRYHYRRPMTYRRPAPHHYYRRPHVYRRY